MTRVRSASLLFAALACAAGLLFAAESKRPMRELDEPAPLPDEWTLTPEAVCLRAERLLEQDTRSSMREARSLLEEIAPSLPPSACLPATLSRTLAAISLRSFEDGDALTQAVLENARAALAIDPASARAQAAMAIAMLLDLRPAAAREAAEAALAADAESPPVLRAVAAVRLSMGDLQGARDVALKALALRPDLPLHHHLLGSVAYLQGAEAESILAYRNALALDPSHIPSRIQLAMAYEQAGDGRAAAAEFRKVIADDPSEAGRAHVAMARAIMRRGGWRPALELLGRAELKARRGFGEGTLFHLRALCHEELGELEEARAAYRRVIDDFPDATPGPGSVERLADWAFEGLARVETSRRDPDAAAKALEEGGARAEAGTSLLIALARFYRTYNFPEKALAAYERAAARLQTYSTAPALAAAFVEWARLAASRPDRGALEGMARSLDSVRPLLEGTRDDVVDLDAARALSIAGRGEDAARWLGRAVARGYRQLDWIGEDPEMGALRASAGFASLRRLASSPPPGG